MIRSTSGDQSGWGLRRLAEAGVIGVEANQEEVLACDVQPGPSRLRSTTELAAV
jgi:hypothetical protein